MIKYNDFAVKVTKPGNWNKKPEIEPLEETLLRLNGWIEENELLVMNVETILMPNVYEKGSTATKSQGAYKSSEPSGIANLWYQIFRVWYQA